MYHTGTDYGFGGTRFVRKRLDVKLDDEEKHDEK